jgi:diguanylate cyclase (GGDEF)-like protein
LLVRIVKFIKSFFITSMSDSDKAEFIISIYTINVVRAKITSITFVILEIMMLLAHCRMNRENLFNVPYIYYGAMYIIMLVVMIVFFIIFTKLGTDVSKNISHILRTRVFFIGFILMWCAGISLLDQLSSGQVAVYVVAVISIAVAPFYEPVILFLVYFTIHTLFLIAMPYFQESAQLLLANSINTTAFVIMSWSISFMRYKKQAEDFMNKKLILKKTDELRLINIQLQEANQKLQLMSITDGLTGIINRLTFETIIKDEWSRCKQHSIPLSLILVDVDFFKKFNDNYGHQAGDCCIKLIADVLTAYVKRSSDKVARYGGDEFVVLLPHTDKENALNLAEQMRKRVEEKSVPHLYSSVSDHVTISLGINTIIPSDESSMDEFISNTDKALYMAKERRNCSVFAMQQQNYEKHLNKKSSIL